jgi:hypothetical protein
MIDPTSWLAFFPSNRGRRKKLCTDALGGKASSRRAKFVQHRFHQMPDVARLPDPKIETGAHDGPAVFMNAGADSRRLTVDLIHSLSAFAVHELLMLNRVS